MDCGLEWEFGDPSSNSSQVQCIHLSKNILEMIRIHFLIFFLSYGLNNIVALTGNQFMQRTNLTSEPKEGGLEYLWQTSTMHLFLPRCVVSFVHSL